MVTAALSKVTILANLRVINGVNNSTKDKDVISDNYKFGPN
jgi:hypothetical protein